MRELKKQNRIDAQKTVQNLIEHSEKEQKVNSMIGEALKQKEGLIEELEKELALEQTRREQMNKRFEKQMADFTSE